jgi:hypothetical protein
VKLSLINTLTVASRGTALSCVPALGRPHERALVALATTMTPRSAASAVVVSPRFVLPTPFVEVLERLPRKGFLEWRS